MTDPAKKDAPVVDAAKPDAAKPDAAAVADPAKTGAADPAAGGDPKAPALHKPEGLPDHMLGAADTETIDKLFAAYDGARKELSKKRGVPEKLDDYKLELSEAQTKDWLRPGEDGKDPVFETLRATFHAEGVAPDAALRVVQKLYEQATALAGEGTDAVLEDIDSGYTSFGGLEKAQPLIDANTAWIDGLKTSGVIDEKDAEDMKLNLVGGVGLKWMDKIRVKTGEKPIPVNLGASAQQGGKTKAELDTMMQDPKYWRDKDPAFIAEVTEGYQKLYNEKQ